MKKIIGIVVMVLALAAINALALDVPASVTVVKSCGLTVTGGSPITFGNVATGTESSNQTVNIKNAGSAPTTTFKVYGTAWTGGTGMAVGQTSVYDTVWNALIASPGNTIYSGVINNGETKNPLFKVAIPDGQSQASYSQTITFTASC